jgi:antirestriction protein
MLLSPAIVEESTIRVHFWNLAAYVNGRLVGDWVDLDACADFDDFCDQVREVTRNAEEILMGDHECDYGIKFGEFTALKTVWEVHEALTEIREDEREAFVDYLEYQGGLEYLDQARNGFEDAYRGRWDSIEDYALEFASDVYSEFFKNVPPGFRVEVDVVAWEQDVWRSDNGHIFWCH